MASNTKRTREERLEPRAADGSPLVVCAGGCGRGTREGAPLPASWLKPCPRCGTLVCRVCAEDQPHVLGNGLCPLPPGQQPKVWGNDPEVAKKYAGCFNTVPSGSEDRPRPSGKE